jgi:hypothetical protein
VTSRKDGVWRHGHDGDTIGSCTTDELEDGFAPMGAPAMAPTTLVQIARDAIESESVEGRCNIEPILFALIAAGAVDNEEASSTLDELEHMGEIRTSGSTIRVIKLDGAPRW